MLSNSVSCAKRSASGEAIAQDDRKRLRLSSALQADLYEYTVSITIPSSLAIPSV